MPTRSSSPFSRALAAALLIALAGCKRPQPSDDYLRAAEIHSRLYAQQLDEAYLAPEMERAEALLQQVPADSADAQAARELLQRIRESRARVTAEQAERQAARAKAAEPPVDPFPSRPPEPPPPPPAAAEEPPDAGSPQPLLRMPLAEFTQRFSTCFQPFQKVIVEGRGEREAWILKDIARCRDRHPGFDRLVILIEDGAIWQMGSRNAIRQVVLDGGTP